MRSSTLIAGLMAVALLAAPPVAAGRAADHPEPGVAAAQSGPKDYSRNAATGDVAGAGDTTALSPRVQDLRWLAAGNSIRTSSLAGTTSATNTGDPQAAALAQERYYSSYRRRADVLKAARPPGADDDPWVALAVGFVGGCLVVGGAAAIARRTRQPRVAA
jgi:hypothetical protein